MQFNLLFCDCVEIYNDVAVYWRCQNVNVNNNSKLTSLCPEAFNFFKHQRKFSISRYLLMPCIKKY